MSDVLCRRSTNTVHDQSIVRSKYNSIFPEYYKKSKHKQIYVSSEHINAFEQHDTKVMTDIAISIFLKRQHIILVWMIYNVFTKTAFSFNILWIRWMRATINSLHVNLLLVFQYSKLQQISIITYARHFEFVNI